MKAASSGSPSFSLFIGRSLKGRVYTSFGGIARRLLMLTRKLHQQKTFLSHARPASIVCCKLIVLLVADQHLQAAIGFDRDGSDAGHLGMPLDNPRISQPPLVGERT